MPGKIIRGRILLAVVILLAASVLTAGCGRGKKAEVPPPAGTPVEVTSATRSTVMRTVDITGSVRALEDVTLSAKMAGKVTRVPFREGDRVSAGAVVVQQETVDISNSIRSAEAGVRSAEAQLGKARAASQLQQDVTPRAIRQAEENLRNAREALAIMKQGARTQERRQAESAVASAEASYRTAKADLDRARLLFQQGAISKAQLDAEEQRHDMTKAGLDSAKQALSLVQEGPRQEELRVAENNVKVAEEALAMAKADRRQIDLRKQDVQASLAMVESSKAGLAMARQALADSSVKSPIAGVVAERRVEPGEMLAPGVPVIRVYNPKTTYVEGILPEVRRRDVRLGQSVNITSQAVSGETFSGKVAEIFPAADDSNRSFRVRISLDDPDSALKPGMFIKAKIIVEERPDRLVIPRDAILTTPDGEVVFTVEDSRAEREVPSKKRGEKPTKEMVDIKIARRLVIQTGLQTDGMAEILNGLKQGQTIVRRGKDYLSDGQELNIVGRDEVGN